MKTLITGIVLFLVLLIIPKTQAQQLIAYLDSDEIIPKMESYQKMHIEFQNYEKELQAVTDAKGEKLQHFYESFQADAMNKTPKQKDEADLELQKMQEDLRRELEILKQKKEEKATELLEPVYEEYNKALEKIALENGYSYILDKKMLLYFDNGADITNQVKAVLGIE